MRLGLGIALLVLSVPAGFLAAYASGPMHEIWWSRVVLFYALMLALFASVCGLRCMIAALNRVLDGR